VDRDNGQGPNRFDSQYWRANTTPWERYVLTPAGTVADRLPSGDSGFANLKLAGDWTATGIDGGCVEAAVISGMDAARAITGDPMEVPGKGTAWLQPPRELPPYVEFGGRATAPSPFACQGGTMRTLLLEGKADAIANLVDRMFNVPAGRGVVYRSFGAHVMMMMGNFKRITSLTQPFDRWGAVRETQASFWIPVLAGRYFGGIFIAERLLMAVPYVFVDNPMSYLGGRETYGYAKVMGRFDPALGLADHVTLEAFGGDFGRMEGADWRKFLELSSGGQTRTPAQRPRHTGTMPLVQLLMGDGTQLKEGEELVLGDLTLGTGLVGDLFAERMSQVFLKQFRDATDGKRACYQAVVEAPVQIQNVAYSLTERDWTLTVHPLDSHPIHTELGITTQQAQLALDMEIDFVVQNGFEVGRVVAPQSPAAHLPPIVHDGPIGFVEGAVRWAWREISKHI
jgi:Flavin containing amine oxidoreductase